MGQSDDFGKLRITTWMAGKEPETMAFQLDGVECADPDALAEQLQKVCPTEAER